jgi:two-component system chemotaxis response regulator CheB
MRHRDAPGSDHTDEAAAEAARPPFDVIVIAASAGGVPALQQVLAALPADFPVPVAIVQHRTARPPNLLAKVLRRSTPLHVVQIERPGVALRPGTIYLAPPDRHLLVTPELILDLEDGHRVRHVLSSANPLFASAAAVAGGRVLAVVLTGGDSDATDGVQSVKAAGGTVIVQDPATAAHWSMPLSAIATGVVDHVVPLGEIGPMLVRLAGGATGPTARGSAGR